MGYGSRQVRYSRTGRAPRQPEEALRSAATYTALRRLGQPEDVANVIAFLAGPDSGWVTGQNVRASGGLWV